LERRLSAAEPSDTRGGGEAVVSLYQVVVQRKLVAPLDRLLHSDVGPESPERNEVLLREGLAPAQFPLHDNQVDITLRRVQSVSLRFHQLREILYLVLLPLESEVVRLHRLEDDLEGVQQVREDDGLHATSATGHRHRNSFAMANLVILPATPGQHHSMRPNTTEKAASSLHTCRASRSPTHGSASSVSGS